MTKDADKLAGRFDSENTGGVLSGFLAEEDEFDRRALWRLGSWAVGSVGAVVIALMAHQSSIGWRHEQLASVDLARQSQQIQTIAKDSQSEARRLASAIDTLNSDRDRLYSRISVLEQGLDSVTGALAKKTAISSTPAAAASATPGPPVPAEVQKLPPAPPVSPVATAAPATVAPSTPAPTPSVAPAMVATAEKPLAAAAVPDPAPATVSSLTKATSNPPAPAPPAPAPLVASKSMMGPPDPAASKLTEPEAPPKPATANVIAPPMPSPAPTPAPEVVASVPPAAANEAPEAMESLPRVQRTEFGVDVGGANSVAGLRALWRGLLKWRSNAPLAALHPIIVIKENSTGLGMQLRLVAGPLNDAAAAAKICAGMLANDRPCETAQFDGQRLALNGNDQPAPTAPTTRYVSHRHGAPKHVVRDEPPPPPKPEPSTMSLIFGTH